MAKKIFLIFLTLAFEISLLFLSLNLSSAFKKVEPKSQKALSRAPSADEVFGKEKFSPQKPNLATVPVKTLELVGPEQSSSSWVWEIRDKEQLIALQALAAETMPMAGSDLLVNYFQNQTAPFPLLWTNSEVSARLSFLPLAERNLGSKLLGLARSIDKPAQEARLVIENGKAKEFSPHEFGEILDLAASRRKILSALKKEEATVKLSIQRLSPRVKLASLNSLGIKDFLGRGQSDFSGSSSSRIKNIKVGAAQYRGLLVAPNEEFSFNKYLGPIDAAHGYRPELVIKPEGTVPEFGGGLCQVSSTAFRAAFFSGLPITQRRNHSYAVRYYQWISDDRPKAVGLDATIYPGAQDLKFINDTRGAILVWTRVEGTKLFFDFYGTQDGRKIVVEGPYEYDRKLSGAVKAKVSRTVIKSQQAPETLTFQSNYVSPELYPKIYEYPKSATTTIAH